ncbi:TnsD family Tn7-like transposition protein [Aliidiomarina indica]|uniref:TnsD family Tn7-like transposition protein n=1 Tax=Aliidiomarina indica TaxID=2749147 RepID=UPI00188DFA4D|nr:TnsD family Tn7-like transposition protein [Aliidiomarina indica]
MSIALYAPRIQPDETLYSYVARCQHVWGMRNSRSLAKDWFGRESVSINQVLPIEISKIANWSDYETNYLLSKHTLLDLYGIFTGRNTELKRVMLGSNALSLANTSTLSQLGHKSVGYSCICPICYNSDVARIGVGYWHLIHQFNGVTACPTHQCELVESRTDSRQYILPSLPNNYVYDRAPEMQVRFAKFVANCIEQSRLSNERAHDDLHRYPVLFKRGQNLDMRSLMHLLDAIELGLDIPKIVNEHHVRKILRKPLSPIHPFKALILRFALSFLSVDNREAPVSAPKGVTDKQARRCAVLLREAKYSMREVSRRVGVSVGYVKQTAKLMGVSIDQRRQTITPDIERNIKGMAIGGACRNDIASKFEVSVGAVEQIIQSVSGLVVWRQYLRLLSKRNSARKVLLEMMKQNPNHNRTQLRQLVQKEYGLLYKYDKKWLFDALPANEKRQYYGHKLWLRRDKELLPQLKEFIRLALEDKGELPSQYETDQALGGHSWFNRSPAKLPVCSRFYRRVTRKFSHCKDKENVTVAR